MFFASDNAGPAHPAMIEALAKANSGYAKGYGNDEIMARVTAQVREIFDAPEAAVYLVATGTAANSLLLGTLADPWQTVFCADIAHVQEDECNAPEFYMGGAKLTLVPTVEARITAEALEAKIAAEESRGIHGPKRGPVTVTQATEKGTIYSLDQLRSVTDVARRYDLPVHMDGARFTNALVRLGCSPAEATWRSGVDALSFGGTKNGCIGVEVAVLFDPAKALEFEYRRKRGAHLFSKHRYLSAQVEAYLAGDLWLDLGRKANAGADRLAAGLQAKGVELVYPPQSNLLFFRAEKALHRRLIAAGAEYYPYDGDPATGAETEMLVGRLVCDWSVSDENIERFLALI